MDDNNISIPNVLIFFQNIGVGKVPPRVWINKLLQCHAFTQDLCVRSKISETGDTPDRINTGIVSNVTLTLAKKYKDRFEQLFNGVNILDYIRGDVRVKNNTYDTLIKLVLRVCVRLNRAVNQDIFTVERKTTLYRFASEYEYEIFNSIHVVTLRQVYDVGAVDISIATALAPNNSNLSVSIRPIIYHFRSAPPKINLSIRNYLSRDKGVGGNIIGFQQYKNIEINKDWGDTTGTIDGSFNFFKRTDRRMVVLVGNNTNDPLIPTNYNHLYSNRQNDPPHPTVIENIQLNHLDETVEYKEGFLKIFHAGMFLQPKANISEVNFIGVSSMMGFLIEGNNVYDLELGLICLSTTNLITRHYQNYQNIDIKTEPQIPYDVKY